MSEFLFWILEGLMLCLYGVTFVFLCFNKSAYVKLQICAAIVNLLAACGGYWVWMYYFKHVTLGVLGFVAPGSYIVLSLGVIIFKIYKCVKREAYLVRHGRKACRFCKNVHTVN